MHFLLFKAEWDNFFTSNHNSKKLFVFLNDSNTLMKFAYPVVFSITLLILHHSLNYLHSVPIISRPLSLEKKAGLISIILAGPMVMPSRSINLSNSITLFDSQNSTHA